MKKIFLISFYLVFISFFVIAASVSTDKEGDAEATVKWDTTGASGISFGFYSDLNNTALSDGYIITTTSDTIDLDNKSITGTGSGYIGWNIISSESVVVEISATPFESKTEGTSNVDKIPLLVYWGDDTTVTGAEVVAGSVGSTTTIPDDSYDAVKIFEHDGSRLGTSGNVVIGFLTGNAYGKTPDKNYKATVTISVKDDSAGGGQ